MLAAVMGAATDVMGYVLALPRFATDLLVWGIQFLRDFPGLAKNVFNGNQKTLDELASFCAWQPLELSSMHRR